MYPDSITDAIKSAHLLQHHMSNVVQIHPKCCMCDLCCSVLDLDHLVNQLRDQMQKENAAMAEAPF